MAYETKVLLAAIVRILKTSKTLDEATREIIKIANIEGIILE